MVNDITNRPRRSKALSTEDVKRVVQADLEKARKEIQQQADASELALKLEIQKVKNELAIQAQTSQASFMTILGIFASFISFLTLEFQFLKLFNNIFQVLGFTFILFALLLSFNIGLDYLVKTRLDKGTPKPHLWFYGVIFMTLVLGLLLILKAC